VTKGQGDDTKTKATILADRTLIPVELLPTDYIMLLVFVMIFCHGFVHKGSV